MYVFREMTMFSSHLLQSFVKEGFLMSVLDYNPTLQTRGKTNTPGGRVKFLPAVFFFPENIALSCMIWTKVQNLLITPSVILLSNF